MRPSLPAVAAAAVLVTACGGSTVAAPSPSTSPTSQASPDATSPAATTPSPTGSDTVAAVEDLDTLLLTVPDLPTGWDTMDVASAEEDGANTASNICGAATGNIDWTENASATGKVAFSAGQGRVIVQQVSMLGESQAAAALDEFAAAGASCEQWTEQGVTFTAEPVTGLPDLGDQMVALRGASQGSPSFTIDMVAWRHGGITDGIAYFDVGGSGGTEELTAIVEAADAKFG
jgi:hypothetical protein